MEGELFWTLDDDVLAGRVPSDHVMVLWTLEETGDASGEGLLGGGGRDLRVEFCEESRLGL